MRRAKLREAGGERPRTEEPRHETNLGSTAVPTVTRSTTYPPKSTEIEPNRARCSARSETSHVELNGHQVVKDRGGDRRGAMGMAGERLDRVGSQQRAEARAGRESKAELANAPSTTAVPMSTAVLDKSGLPRNLATRRDPRPEPIVKVSREAREPVPGPREGRESRESEMQVRYAHASTRHAINSHCAGQGRSRAESGDHARLQGRVYCAGEDAAPMDAHPTQYQSLLAHGVSRSSSWGLRLQAR